MLKKLYTVPKIVRDNSIGHLVEKLIGKTRIEPYSYATSYYLLITQDSAHTTWHQDFSATSVCYTVLRGETFFLVKPTKKNMAILEKLSDAENDQT